jgi:two-component system nitrate/nitrite response regulator NarL
MTNSNGKLTPREVEILQLAANGLCNGEIGLKLGIAESTVKNRMHVIFSKLDVCVRLEAVLEGIRRGYVVVPGIRRVRDDHR